MLIRNVPMGTCRRSSESVRSRRSEKIEVERHGKAWTDNYRCKIGTDLSVLGSFERSSGYRIDL